MSTANPVSKPLDDVRPIVQSRRGEPVWELATLYANQGEWTEDQYLALNTNRLVELVDGCLEWLTMPGMFHQLVVLYLYEVLKAFVVANTKGIVLVAPFPVRLWEGNLREPDVVFLKPRRVPADLKSPPNGADLAMEVVSDSPADRKRDLEIKREQYAQAGIAEYWIIDPALEHITVLTLDGQTYREHGVFTKGGQATSVLLPSFSVSVDAVFAAGQPSF